jgi:AraC family transcriptional regulator
MYLTLDDQGLSQNFAERSGNFVIYSSLTQFDAVVPFRNFAIKYVSEGTEHYTVNGRDYPLKNNEYLLGNKTCVGQVAVDSKKYVKGICIDIEQDILSAALASFVAPDTADLDMSIDRFFNAEDFMEYHGHTLNTALGHQLSQLSTILSGKPNENYIFENDFYFNLAETVMKDYTPIVRQLHKLRTVKSSTKKDLLYRINKGKLFIDHMYSDQICIEEVARESHISLFHFFRLFKEIYNISPYQYIKHKRMQKAGDILSKEDIMVSELAGLVGYNDLFSFSKAFKQYHGCSPSQYRKV